MSHQLRFAVHSIIWGPNAEIETIAQEAKAAGYTGVELFQHPIKVLGGAERVYNVLKSHGVTLLGSCGGTYEDRRDFIQQYCKLDDGVNPADSNSPYIYIDEWRDKFVVDLPHFRLALHPHMFRTIQTLVEAKDKLRRHKKLRFLPDTAHLTIAGESPLDVLHSPFFERIDAIHFKDWRNNVSRSYPFYARGFCELGIGSIALPMEKIIETLHHRKFEGWIVVEQDRAKDYRACIKNSLSWLQKICEVLA